MLFGTKYERCVCKGVFPNRMHYICVFSGLTCVGLTGSSLAIHPCAGAESSGEVLVHHTADVPLVVGKKYASRAQVLSFPHLLLFLST